MGSRLLTHVAVILTARRIFGLQISSLVFISVTICPSDCLGFIRGPVPAALVVEAAIYWWLLYNNVLWGNISTQSLSTKRKCLRTIPGGGRFPCGNKNVWNLRLDIKVIPICGARTIVGSFFELTGWTSSFSRTSFFTRNPLVPTWLWAFWSKRTSSKLTI